MKLFAVPRKTAAQVVVALIVIGALLGHDYPKSGLVVTLCAVGFYLLLVGRRRIGYLLRFGRIAGDQRVLVGTAACMLYVFARGAFAGTVSYFLLLILFAADYFIYDRRERNMQS